VASCQLKNLLKQVNQNMDNETKFQIYGCLYQIPKQVLVQVLTNYGELLSSLTEELFDGGGSPNSKLNGNNRTGKYLVLIKLKRNMPELIPTL
jgi:hypothetical protein